MCAPDRVPLSRATTILILNHSTRACSREFGPDRVARTNIAEPRDFLQKDLDTCSRERADLHVSCERKANARLVALLMEVDSRKLYAGQGYASLFTYCVQVLHLSEHAAYLRIEAARATRRFPAILDKLSDGSIHLTAVSLLGPHLTSANHVELLDEARHKTKREVEQLIARVRPQPDVPAVVRKLPAPKPAALLGSEVPRSGVPVAESELPIAAADTTLPVMSAPVAPRRPEIKPLAPARAGSPTPFDS